MPQSSFINLSLDVKDQILEKALKELLPQAGISIADQATDSQGILLTSPQPTQDHLCPSLNLHSFTWPMKFLDLLSHIENLPYQQDIKFAHFTLDIRDKKLKDLEAGKAQRLTEKEVQLLRCFYSNLGNDVSKSQLLCEIWGYHPDAETHTLETHIYRLRQKLEKDPNAPEVLLNGPKGYYLKK